MLSVADLKEAAYNGTEPEGMTPLERGFWEDCKWYYWQWRAGKVQFEILKAKMKTREERFIQNRGE